MYGAGFLVFAGAAIVSRLPRIKRATRRWSFVLLIFVVLGALLIQINTGLRVSNAEPVSMPSLVGVQMEFPPVSIIPKMLDQALAKNTNAPIFVLSEYTLDGPVPNSLKNWCRDNARFLVVGGEDVLDNEKNYTNTAFVVGTNGDIVFEQAKSVPVQCFKDGLPAPGQKVWNSPWGKIGICICYDLSYTRVTDELVRQGAQLLIVPTMDLEDWGRHQHELHSRVAPVRAAEYGIPIFRVASSGISQAVAGGGYVVAQTKIPGSGEIFSAQLRLPMRGAIPLDRYLAPMCVAMTGIVTAVLLILAWKAKRPQIAPIDADKRL
jgi:apolipoprotein N-acyltransferase